MTAHATRETHATHRAFGAFEWGMTAFLAIVWGASFLFIRVGVETFGAGLVPAMRIAFGVLALSLFPASWKPVAQRDWPSLALLGVLWMAIPFLLFALAERTVSTAVTGMINGSVPLASAGVAAVWQRKAPSMRRGFALLVGLFGVSVIALAASHDASHAGDRQGLAMLLAGVLCYGVSSNLSRPLQLRYGAFPVLFRAGLIALIASLPFGLYSAPAARFSWTGLGCLFVLGAVGTGLAYSVAATLVGRTDATRGTIGVFLTPIVATLLGVSLRHESLPPGALLGTGLVLVGAVLTSRPEKS